jgi:subtilisin-like proprotein convertase family protein
MKKLLLVLILLCFMQNGFSQMAYNNALYLDSTMSGYFAVPNEAELNPTTQITLEAWVYVFRINGTNQTIISKNSLTSYNLTINPSGKVIFYPKGGTPFIGKSVIPAKTWTHIAGIYDGTTTSIVINGTLDTSTTAITGAIGVNTDSLYIGCDKIGTNPAYVFRGYIDNVRVWSNAKTAAEIFISMYIPLTIHGQYGNNGTNYSGLKASWQFNNTNDWSGFVDNNGYLRNGADYLNLSQKTTDYCDYNNCVRFVGNGTYLSGANSTDYNASTALTLEAWIKRDTTGAQNIAQHIINKSGSTSRFNYGLYVASATNNLYFAINDGSQYVSSPANSLSLGQWYHAAGTYEQSTGLMKLYINGDSVAGAVIPGNIAINNNPDSLCIGGVLATSYSANKFKGYIDGIRIWKDFAKTPNLIKGEMYKSRIQDAVNVCSEITFDTYSNLVHSPNNGWGYGVPLNFFAGARIMSTHYNLDPNQTSPMLAANELDFYGTSTNTVSTKRFFIPDNNTTGVTDSVYYNAGGTITDISAFVLASHYHGNDLRITLTSPSGVSIMLTPTSSSGNPRPDIMTIFTSTADSTINYISTNFINSTMAPFSPKIKPANPFTPFIGLSRQGWWKMKFADNVANGLIGYVHGWGVRLMSTTSAENENTSPYKYELSQNYPNPFNPVTTIKFQTAKLQNVKISIFDILGNEAAVLLNETMKPGNHSIDWDASQYSSGVYFYKLVTDGFTDTKKMLLIK